MYSADGTFWFLAVVNVIWLLVLSFLVWQNNFFFKKLFPERGGSFKEKLEEVLKEIEDFRDLKRESIGYFQKVALKRYNPYQDTGGDQSFSLALLDGKGGGVVITSLHSRAGTRVFAKPVKNSQEKGFKFSEEEKEAIQEAIAG